MKWKDGRIELDTSRYSPALEWLLDSLMEQVAQLHHRQVTETQLLATLLQARQGSESPDLPNDQRDQYRNAVALLENHLTSGVQLSHCLDAFQVVAEVGAQEIDPFERGNWCEPLPGLIEELPDGAGIPQMLSALFEATERLPHGTLLAKLFQTAHLIEALAASVSGRAVFGGGLADGSSAPENAGVVDDEAFTPRGRFLLDKALTIAAKSGAQTCDSATLMIAMLLAKDTYTQLIMRRAGVNTSTTRMSSHVATVTVELHPGATPLPATASSLNPELRALLQAALRQALATGGRAIGERELLGELLKSPEVKLRYLVDDVLRLPANLVNELLSEIREPEVIEPYLPSDICPTRNVTVKLARSPETAPIGRDQLTTQIVKVFFRKKSRNVLLHGEHGTGASTMADVLADALRQGRFPAMRHTQVIAFDLSGLDGVEYAEAAERLLAFMESEPDRIYVIDGFGKYFAEHFAACARRFAHNTYRLLTFADAGEYTALQAGSEPLKGFLDDIELDEPSAGITAQIVTQAMERIAREYGVTFAAQVSQSAIRMAGDYMLSARFPAKAVDLLQRAAADVAAEAEMTGSGSRTVDRRAIAQCVGNVTGLPVETILGIGQDKDYVDLLSATIVGQGVAVAKVAGRLDLIQKGLVDKKAPAAVFVFAGLSGTGKTELAKQIAQIYSQTHVMISFAMENFGEPHSVSKLIGSPPGYVGYDEGGPLINALNRDPYAVVLLDEVEKAHPAVWDPFLNLFDEGTITDSKGVTASGARAFFVLTSNIGQYEIAEMLARKATPAEIEESVMKLFPKHLHEQARIPSFRPEFIGRVMSRGGIVAFDALSSEALLGIARHGFEKIKRDFAAIHGGTFDCDDAVLKLIADTIYRENDAVIREHRPGYLGARRIQQLLDQYVNNKLAQKIRQIAGAQLVRVVLNGRDTELIPVYDEADAQELIAKRHVELVDRVELRFNQVASAPNEAFSGMSENNLIRLDRLLSEVGAIL
ncbi:MAG: AAA family ATPase [Propionicimonas sp.]